MQSGKDGVTPLSVLAIVAFAFTLRLLVRLATGKDDFLHHGYTLYLSMAQHFLDGDGLCVGTGTGCAWRMPVYPLLMAPLLAKGLLYPWLPAIQSAFGAVTVWLAWKIGQELFGPRAAILAAGMTALNPYAVVHDTSLQETSLFNLLMAAAFYQLLRLRTSQSGFMALGAGVMLGLAMLTTARVGLFVFLAVVWAARAAGPTPRLRYRQAGLVALPILLLVGGWMVRNWVVVGAPVVSTLSGKNLWVGNNEWTFSHFPEGSIDLSQAESLRNLSPSQRAALWSIKSEVGQDKLEGTWALEYAKAHPGLLAWRAVKKLWSALSAQFSPARGRALGVAYRALFIVIHILAAIGLWRMRDDRWARTLIVQLLASFAVMTAVYWAHTSHKSYLDVVLFACAASVIAPRILDWRSRPHAPSVVESTASCVTSV